MLKIIRNPEFKAPVTVMIPHDGGQREGQFTARFRALTRSEEEAFDRTTAAGTDDLLRSIVVGWEGLADDDGLAMDFSPANLNMLLDLQYIRFGLVQAYFSAVSGAKAARRGN